MKKLDKLYTDVNDFCIKTFGANRDTQGILNHMEKEVTELKNAVKNGDRKNIEEEFADLFILLLNAAGNEKITASELIQFATEKMEINKNRKWGTMQKNGIVEHLK